MPKVVDSAERRTRIADALLRIAAERGLESVSIRHVAAEAGVSTGMVQHHFKDKDEMINFALDTVRERVGARLESSAREHDPLTAPIAFVRSLLYELLPRDRRRRDEGRVTLAFLAYSAVRPRTARALRSETAQLVNLLTQGITRAQANGTIRATSDPQRTAKGLLAHMEGLGLHTLLGHYRPDEAMHIFDAYADTIAHPAPHHPTHP